MFGLGRIAFWSRKLRVGALGSGVYFSNKGKIVTVWSRIPKYCIAVWSRKDCVASHLGRISCSLVQERGIVLLSGLQRIVLLLV